MLKSTLTPFFSSFHGKPRVSNLASISTVANGVGKSAPIVRQNVSPNSPPSIPSYQLPPTSAYIHLPFCRKRCHYCDFPIIALGSSSATDDDPRIINYVELLCREIDATKNDLKSNSPLQTVFFGGGTPSLVSPKLVSMILDRLRLKLGLDMAPEVSMEMDPGTFDARKMEEMLKLGVNRVSLGVQAFQDELLKACGRAHGVKEVYEAIDIVKSCGIGNWSMDLISSLPHQTDEMWEESLKSAIEARPSHVSVYDLQVEEDTKFGALYNPGEFPLPSETNSAGFYKMASRILTEADYSHYEISSYSKIGFECKHNLTYWKNKSFYGFGLGAASFLGGLRFSRPRKLKDYANYVHNLEKGLVDCHGNGDVDAMDMAMDSVMLSLRTSRGLELKRFEESYGGSLAASICRAFRPYVESGHVIWLDEGRKSMDSEILDEHENGRLPDYIRLSDPHGFLLSNVLISVAFRSISP